MVTRAERAARLHAALTARLAALRQAERGALLHFATIHREQLFRELGYSSIHAYGREALGFSERKLSAFVRLSEALERLPATRRAVEAGVLPWTKARELVSVATPATETRWLAEAQASSRRALERKVCAARARPLPQRQRAAAQPDLALAPTPAETARSALEAAVPLRLSFALSAEQFGRWEALVERLRKAGRRESREELLLAALAALADEAADAAESAEPAQPATRPRGRVAASPFQVILRRCPDCGAIAQVTGRGERPADSALAARAACDGDVLAPGGGLTRSLTPALRRRILARDGHRCQALGCGATRFLEVHHLVPRSHGGGQEEANLVTLCARCHQLLHERGGLPGLTIRTVEATLGAASARGSP
ncbi:HNH endonuclease [bacterium]|nr:HNH endonuclease [bacterium]